jgi:hypothetical protein
MGEVLKEHFNISESDPPDAVAARLADHQHLGLTLGLEADESLHPLVARERLHDAWVEFLAELVRERPGVLLIEDLHWAEDDMCDLIDTLVAHVEGPLLLLITARPEMLDRRPAWGGAWGRTSSMRLEALPPADTGRMLTELIGADVPEPIRDLVVGRAEGSPFFVEELIGTLIDRGVLAKSNGTWSFGDLPADLSLPDPVQTVLAARIDLLPSAEKAALQAASVIGRTFWTGPVYELVAGESPDVGLLEERDFVRRSAGSSLSGEREYVFKHALIREVAYESLPRARRARMHAAFARWFERRAEGREELAPLVAHHYAEAVRPEAQDLAWAGQHEQVLQLRASAVAWSMRAAELAVSRYEIDDGLALLRRAVELEPDPGPQAGLWFEIGRVSALKYDGTGFVAAMERALELGAPDGQVYAELAFQTTLRQGMWRQRLDASLVEGWIERAVAVTPEGTPSRVRALAAKAYWHDDLPSARAAVTVAEELGIVELRFDGLGALQSVLGETGRPVEACEVAEVRAELFPLISDPDQLADGLYMNADLYTSLGRLAEARGLVGRLEETVAGLTHHHRVHGLAWRMRLEVAVGDWEAASALTQRTEDAVEANLATPCPFNVGLLLLAGLSMVHGGDEATATRLVEKAESVGMVGYTKFHAARRLSLAVARQDHEETRRIVDSVEPGWLTPSAWELWSALFDGLAVLDDRDRVEAEAPQWLGSDAYVTPFAVRALAMVRKDGALLTDAIARFDAMGLRWHARQTRAVLDRDGS